MRCSYQEVLFIAPPVAFRLLILDNLLVIQNEEW